RPDPQQPRPARTGGADRAALRAGVAVPVRGNRCRRLERPARRASGTPAADRRAVPGVEGRRQGDRAVPRPLRHRVLARPPPPAPAGLLAAAASPDLGPKALGPRTPPGIRKVHRPPRLQATPPPVRTSSPLAGAAAALARTAHRPGAGVQGIQAA